MLRDCFVCGLRSTSSQKKLLTEENLKYGKAVQIAVGYKGSATDTAELQVPSTSGLGDTQEALPTHKVNVKKVGDGKLACGSCFRCGRGGHHPSKCRFKAVTCFKCQKTGHMARVCKSKITKAASKSDKTNKVYD